MIWANLLHLSTNMWVDYERPRGAPEGSYYDPSLRFDTHLWDDLTERMVAAGMNMVVIDLGEGVRYRTHPELAVRGSWAPARLRRELGRIRKRGLEPIPKLNFSTAHDAWLGPYARCVSTEPYYAVCRDLVREVIDLFDQPRFFHLGMDEEDAVHQRLYDYAVMRQHDLWWHDVELLISHVRGGGSRPWADGWRGWAGRSRRWAVESRPSAGAWRR